MKTLIPFLTTVLFFIFPPFESALASAPSIQWQKTFGGSSYDGAYSVQQTIDGGYIITGYTSSFGPGDPNVYLIKTDHNGGIHWQKNFGGSNRDEGLSVRQTSDGGYVIAGETRSYGAGSADVYLIKTDPNGNDVWQKTFGGSELDSAYSVQQTTDGGYIIAGYTHYTGTGDMDVYLIKTDPNGDMLWQKTFGGIDWGYSDSVQQTSDGGYIIAAMIDSFGIAYPDVHLIKTHPDGNLNWQKTFGGIVFDAGHSVQQTFDGGYIIAGSTSSFGAGSYDVYLIKTDPNGNKKWQKTFGGSDIDIAYSVQQTSDGGYIIAGLAGAISINPVRGGDFYLIKTDPNANIQWEMTFGGSSNDSGRSVQQTSDGGYIIAGSTSSYGAGGSDVYLIKLSCERTWPGDINCNGTVNFEDLKVLVAQWLQPPDILSADIYPEPGDGIVNGFDFAALARDWLQTTAP